MPNKLNKTTRHLLKLLPSGKLLSGTELRQELNMTRGGVWKAIQQLQQMGLAIQSTPDDNYRLAEPIELLQQNSIARWLPAEQKKALDEILILEQIDSTNNFLMAKAQSGSKEKLACFAEQQTAGRGRRERDWISPFGTNIYFSLLWHLNNDISELNGLSLATAVAVLRALKSYGVVSPIQLKWPNDIFCHEKKLGGILIEMIGQPHTSLALVIGIGINTYMNPQQAQGITQAWTSLQEVTQSKVERNRLAGLLLSETIQMLQQFHNAGLKPFLSEWRAHDYLYQRPIEIMLNTDKINGTMLGIDDIGRLLVKNVNQEVKAYAVGKVA